MAPSTPSAAPKPSSPAKPSTPLVMQPHPSSSTTEANPYAWARPASAVKKDKAVGATAAHAAAAAAPATPKSAKAANSSPAQKSMIAKAVGGADTYNGRMRRLQAAYPVAQETRGATDNNKEADANEESEEEEEDYEDEEDTLARLAAMSRR